MVGDHSCREQPPAGIPHRLVCQDGEMASLGELLATLHPELVDGRFVFTAVASLAEVLAAGVEPVVTVRELEGLTAIMTVEEAARLGLDSSFEAAMISLGVSSELDAVGLTAAVSTALAEIGIAANVVAGLHHDHLFVPADRSAAALAALRSLSTDAG